MEQKNPILSSPKDGTESCPIDLSLSLMFCYAEFAVSRVAGSPHCSQQQYIAIGIFLHSRQPPHEVGNGRLRLYFLLLWTGPVLKPSEKPLLKAASTFFKMAERYTGFSDSLVLSGSFFDYGIVSLFKGVDCSCVYAMPKRFGRGEERLAGFAVYFYTTDLIVYALCIFMKEKRFVLVKRKRWQSVELLPKRITHSIMVAFSTHPSSFPLGICTGEVAG